MQGIGKTQKKQLQINLITNANIESNDLADMIGKYLYYHFGENDMLTVQIISTSVRNEIK